MDKIDALLEKELGNEAYRHRDFTTALYHYERALNVDPYNIVYRTNRAAVYFEQGDYVQCITECIEAVDLGRTVNGDYKLIAKALARAATAYWHLDDLDNALLYYNKSLAEYRHPDVLHKCREVERELKQRQELAYLDSDKSQTEKQIGNELYNQGNYPEALKHYTEAIRRNPSDAVLYSNRAACYNKLLEFSLAVRDCERCIQLQPTFVKGYLRKAVCLVAMKEYTRAVESYLQALEFDPQCQEAIDGYRNCLLQENRDTESVRCRAMQNPEIQQILCDPVMQLLLRQMQNDPAALQEHLKEQQVAQKIEKLVQAGLITIR